MDTVVRLAQALGISVADRRQLHHGLCGAQRTKKRTTEAQKERQTALHKIDRILGQMNAKGIKVAVERVEELSHVPEYQKTEPHPGAASGLRCPEPSQKPRCSRSTGTPGSPAGPPAAQPRPGGGGDPRPTRTSDPAGRIAHEGIPR